MKKISHSLCPVTIKTQTPRSSLIHMTLTACLIIAGTTTAKAQVQTTQVDVNPQIEQYKISGKIYPQFWKFTSNKQVAFIPLEKIISIGIQDYEVVAGGHVHELSVALEGNFMMRIYFIKESYAKKVAERGAQSGSNPRKTIQKGAVPSRPSFKSNSVIKYFPKTTHLPMMEFLVEDESTVDSLYKSLESAYFDFKMREVVKKQRRQALREIQK